LEHQLKFVVAIELVPCLMKTVKFVVFAVAKDRPAVGTYRLAFSVLAAIGTIFLVVVVKIFGHGFYPLLAIKPGQGLV